MSEIWLDASIKFRKATWADFEPGDVLYYLIQRKHSDNYAHGPMIVVDPARGTIKNAQGVILTAKGWQVQLLKVDLPSLLAPNL